MNKKRTKRIAVLIPLEGTDSWVAKPQHSAEIIHCADGSYAVLLHDANGANAEGYGATVAAAHDDALARYKAARHRASLTTARVGARRA